MQTLRFITVLLHLSHNKQIHLKLLSHKTRDPDDHIYFSTVAPSVRYWLNLFLTHFAFDKCSVLLFDIRDKMAAVFNHCARRYLQTTARNLSKKPVVEGPSAVSGGHEGKANN